MTARPRAFEPQRPRDLAVVALTPDDLSVMRPDEHQSALHLDECQMTRRLIVRSVDPLEDLVYLPRGGLDLRVVKVRAPGAREGVHDALVRIRLVTENFVLPSIPGP